MSFGFWALWPLTSEPTIVVLAYDAGSCLWAQELWHWCIYLFGL